ncbi:hypothetical protein [Sorangium sp. So ce406]|uniref:hypothetical protein n=1 Tax=Sorangium sp. So ce406 TaxID=3133311 RepID=UPI003F5C47CD
MGERSCGRCSAERDAGAAHRRRAPSTWSSKDACWIYILFFGVRRIFAAGVELPERPALKFVGALATDNPAENRTDVFAPGTWLISPVVTTTYTARPGEFVRVNAHGPVTIRLPPAAGNVGASVVVKEVAGEEEAIEVLASTGQQLARDGYPHVTIRLVSDGATSIVI